MSEKSLQTCGNCRHQLLVAVDTSAEDPQLDQSFRWKICDFFPMPSGLPIWVFKAIDDAVAESRNVVRDSDGSNCSAWEPVKTS